MKDKVVLITGGAGGIGQATAKKFLNHGAKVVLVDINEESLKKVKENLPKNDENIKIIQADVTNEADVEKYVKKTVDTFGKIDVFIIPQE